jgi:hypothetical protein
MEWHKDDLASFNDQAAIKQWLAEESVFLRATPATLSLIKGADFEYGAFPFPLYSSHSVYGVAAIQGYYLGVNAASKSVTFS